MVMVYNYIKEVSIENTNMKIYHTYMKIYHVHATSTFLLFNYIIYYSTIMIKLTDNIIAFEDSQAQDPQAIVQ